MTRRTTATTLLLLTASALFLLTHRRFHAPRLSELCLSDTEYAALKVSRQASNELTPYELCFDDAALFADEEGSRLFYSLPEKRSSDDPQVFIRGREKMKLSCDAAASRCVVYTSSEYREYEIVYTSLPVIQIDTRSEKIGAEAVAMRFTLADNRGSTTRIITSEGVIHIRGNSTRYDPKNNFRLTLYQQNSDRENDTALLGLRADGDWILYAAYGDQEKVRNVFSSNLWMDSCARNNSFGLVNGMEYRYTELILNGSYWGLYALGYPIDAKQMNIIPDQRMEYDEFLFKKTSWGNAVKTDARSDGYELQFAAEEFVLNNGISVLDKYYSGLLHTSEEQLEDLYLHTDMDTAVDIFLFLALVQGNDHIIPGTDSVKNIFVTIKADENWNRIILFTPWDLDTVWGNGFAEGSSEHSYTVQPTDNRYVMQLNPVYRLLAMGDKNMAERVRGRYAELRAGDWSDEALTRRLDDLERDIFGSGAFIRDKARWPEGSYVEAETGLSEFRAYVTERMSAMDAWVDETFNIG